MVGRNFPDGEWLLKHKGPSSSLEPHVDTAAVDPEYILNQNERINPRVPGYADPVDPEFLLGANSFWLQGWARNEASQFYR